MDYEPCLGILRKSQLDLEIFDERQDHSKSYLQKKFLVLDYYFGKLWHKLPWASLMIRNTSCFGF